VHFAGRRRYVPQIAEPLDLLGGRVRKLDAHRFRFRAAVRDQVSRLDVVLPEESMDATRGVVARFAAVDDENAPAIAGQKDPAGQPGRTAADDDGVVGRLMIASTAGVGLSDAEASAFPLVRPPLCDDVPA
jgi:hypothetical protein